MTREIKVSILIPSFNAADWIGEAVRSALGQSYPHCEVIVIDDGSSDTSRDILQGFNEQARIIFRENRGGNPTRNELLELAQGEWIQYLDADDALLPDKIERQLEVAKANPGTDVIYSPQIIEHHVGATVREEVWDPHDPNGDHDAWAYHLGWKLTQTGGALFRKAALESVGGWNEAQDRCQDNELYFRLLKAGKRFVRCPHAGSVYRRFEDGTVSTQKQELLGEAILKLLAEGESYLRDIGEWTPRRSQEANQTRFRLARGVWPRDKAMAQQIMRIVRDSQPAFVPNPSPEAPGLYRCIYRAFGFVAAERLAGLRRRLR